MRARGVLNEGGTRFGKRKVGGDGGGESSTARHAIELASGNLGAILGLGDLFLKINSGREFSCCSRFLFAQKSNL